MVAEKYLEGVSMFFYRECINIPDIVGNKKLIKAASNYMKNAGLKPLQLKENARIIKHMPDDLPEGKKRIRMFYYPFSWKRPLIYILIFPAVGLYVYIFYIRCGGEAFGVMERSKEIKVFCVFFVTIFLFHFFRTSHFIQQIESVLLRAILLMGVVFLAMVFILPAWIFNEYDHKKMDTYARILPFPNSPYIRIKDTLVFDTIKTVNPSPGEDTGALRFILHDGQKQSLDIANVPKKSRDIFLVTLYNECDWLRDDLEKQFGSIERRKIYVDGNNEYGYINVVHVLLNTFFLWLFLAQIICLLVYTFKINDSSY